MTNNWGGTANQPPSLDPAIIVPPLRVPGTFGTYPGPSRSPIGTSRVPSIPSGVKAAASNATRRRALVGQTKTVAAVALARASRNARGLIGALPKPRR